MNTSYNRQIFSVSSAEDDPLEALVRRGAKVMLQAALEDEVSEYLERTRHQRNEHEAEFRGYRNGHNRHFLKCAVSFEGSRKPYTCESRWCQ